MGHANLTNISQFFVRRLYAKGPMSITQIVQALAAAGETLHASEGEYDDDGTIGMGVMDVICYLTKENPSQHDYSGPNGGGPWIVPILTAWHGGKRLVTGLTRRMLNEIEKGDHDPLTVHGAARPSIGSLSGEAGKDVAGQGWAGLGEARKGGERTGTDWQGKDLFANGTGGIIERQDETGKREAGLCKEWQGWAGHCPDGTGGEWPGSARTGRARIGKARLLFTHGTERIIERRGGTGHGGAGYRSALRGSA